ncbi:hypothetical protein GCM10027418_05470 [Mariniluteicoccus endophyticus]
MARPTITPTSALDLGAAALVGGVGSWMLTKTLERVNGEPPTLTWVGVGFLAALAAAVVVYAIRMPKEIADEGGHVPGDPRPALVRLALGKSALLGGAALTAGYLVFAWLFVDFLDVPASRERVIHGVLSGLLALVVTGAGWWIERSCRGRWDSGADDDAAGRPD